MDHDVLERILDAREKPTNLSFELLKNITDSFSEERVIGRGGFGIVYKGVLRKGNVAVKRIMNRHTIDEKLFYREVDSLLKVNHQNVVRFLGFCASTETTAVEVEGNRGHIYPEVRERLLCFEYIDNESLQEHITDELRGLEWNTRYEIIKGICQGLLYLHRVQEIKHMDLKPANVLLDNRMVPKITDFGLSRLDENSQTISADRYVSRGYCAPEYAYHGKMSFKSDIFSLGIIIIEVITGHRSIPNNNNVLRRWKNRWKKSAKKTPLVCQQVTKCLEIGLLCQEDNPNKRPFIWELMQDIKEMDGTNRKISNADGSTIGQITPYSEDDMLGIEPLELHFPFELYKQMSCSLQLTNDTDNYIAFLVQNMSPLSYCTRPQKDIMPPRSTCNVEITLQLQRKAPEHMQRADEFIVWSTKVNDGLAVEDITTNMFLKETVNIIDEVNLDVVFDASGSEESVNMVDEVNLDVLIDPSEPREAVNLVDAEVPLPTSSSKYRKRIVIMDSNRVASMLKALTDGIRECYAGRVLNLPALEELYRFCYNLVLHKHGEELYSAVEAAMASEVQDLGRALDGVPDGMLFLQELLAKWDQHRKVLSFSRGMLMHLDRTFVPTNYKTPVYELGLRLWRDSVIRSDKVRPRLINVVRRERGSEYAASASVTGGLIAGVTKMLKELGDDVHREVMDAGDEALHRKAMDVPPLDE